MYTHEYIIVAIKCKFELIHIKPIFSCETKKKGYRRNKKCYLAFNNNDFRVLKSN